MDGQCIRVYDGGRAGYVQRIASASKHLADGHVLLATAIHLCALHKGPVASNLLPDHTRADMHVDVAGVCK
eukprot:CAMPEP_0181503258 /NCGR_PEP_ID=MMETSP1110-20121109/56827_1 /TAXON_ID=174948 /ORGANISM="Symbiodinium sp., Strain CCMP421" /LENGTH=70 /DNA_ID=CAMNT_0023631961 /DNA_START=581 /DNA_END=790 /DNA_ORIENTATION=+